MNLFDLVQSQLSDDMIDQLSNQIGGTREQTQAATNGVISTLVTALAKNAQRPGGVEALVSAVDRDHDGSVLEDAMGFLLGNRKAQNAKTLNGTGIVKHVLGSKQESANDMLGNLTGLNKAQIGKLMITLAPMVMAAIGRARNKEGVTVSGVGDLLSQSVQSSSNKRSELGLIGKFLDKDGDGSVMDDLMDMGKQALLKR